MDFDVHDADPGLDGVRNALENDEHIYHLATDANGRIETYTETGDGYATRIERTGDDYEMVQVFTGDSEHAEQLNTVQDSIVDLINTGIGAYNRTAGLLKRMPVGPDPEAKDTVEADDLGLNIDFTSADYVVMVGGTAPTMPGKDYSQVEPHQLYGGVADEFTGGCRAGNCGSLYLVEDGDVDVLGEGDYVPDDVQHFVD